MKRYTVVWSKTADRRLGELYLAASDGPAVSKASDAIEHKLAREPTTCGQQVQDGLFTVTVEPLKVLFVVKERDRLVRVVHIKRAGDA